MEAQQNNNSNVLSPQSEEKPKYITSDSIDALSEDATSIEFPEGDERAI